MSLISWPSMKPPPSWSNAMKIQFSLSSLVSSTVTFSAWGSFRWYLTIVYVAISHHSLMSLIPCKCHLSCNLQRKISFWYGSDRLAYCISGICKLRKCHLPFAALVEQVHRNTSIFLSGCAGLAGEARGKYVLQCWNWGTPSLVFTCRYSKKFRAPLLSSSKTRNKDSAIKEFWQHFCLINRGYKQGTFGNMRSSPCSYAKVREHLVYFNHTSNIYKDNLMLRLLKTL